MGITIWLWIIQYLTKSEKILIYAIVTSCIVAAIVSYSFITGMDQTCSTYKHRDMPASCLSNYNITRPQEEL